MDADQLQALIEVETEAENFLLARNQMVENDKLRNGNREALTALRRRAKTTKSSVSSPFETVMRELEASSSSPLVKEVCLTCGNHNPNEKTWISFPGSDSFVRVPFHAAHSMLEKEQEKLDYEMKILQSQVKEKSLVISEKGGLADKINPGIVRSMVALSDNHKSKLIL